MKKTLLTILGVCMEVVFAQTPGYLGKKNLISADGLAYLAIGDYVNFLYYDTTGRPGLNLKMGFQVERVISRNHALVAGVQGFDTQKAYLYPDPATPKQASVSHLSLRARSASLGFRWYNRSGFGLPAPLGLYHQADVFVMRYHITDPSGLYPGSQGVNTICWDGGVAYSIGLQRIILGSMMVHGGVQSGIPIGLFLTRFDLLRTITLDDPEAKAAARVFFHSLFMLRAGVGWAF